MIKIFGIGNPLLQDDGIGIEIVKALHIKDQEQIQTYVTEIFVEDALDDIDEDDYVILIDAMDQKEEVGKIHILPFETCTEIINPKEFCHSRSLLSSLLLFYPSMKGEVIGIEVSRIEFKEGLSLELENKFSYIVGEVEQYIEKLARKVASNA